MSVNGASTRVGIAGARSSLPPNQTLYLNNLADKIHKDDMTRALYLLFSAHAHILDIVVIKTKKTRGQAHVVCSDQFAATQAMRSLQGVSFLGKPIRIQYAKGKSKAVTILEGSGAPSGPPKRPSAPAVPVNNTATDLQKQVFGGPPPAGTKMAIPGRPMLDVHNGAANAPSPQGTKRPREEESDGEGAPMDEDADEDGAAMDLSDED